MAGCTATEAPMVDDMCAARMKGSFTPRGRCATTACAARGASHGSGHGSGHGADHAAPVTARITAPITALVTAQVTVPVTGPITASGWAIARRRLP